MNTASASPAERPTRTLVWDAPVRVFHWLMVASFAVAWLTAESERWQLAHVTAGYTMAGLVAFRVVWGLVGTRYARFTAFVRSPWTAVDYLMVMLLERRPQRHTGHNPAGGLAILALLTLAALTAASGWANYNELAGHWMEDVHEVLANTMLGLVALHVVAVVASSALHRENLVGAMIHGRKPVPRAQGIRSPWRSVAALLLAAVLAFWWLQWESAPQQPQPQQERAAHRHKHQGH
ncbi:cytochrome b/b6 domain-containing protein [Ramlibacter alkalitolerans]|uniref:Cytochrome b/b6 domain-containing protein n=1 Tax=Ramlibacter alkalitolerans TaxID=2039631 RepID=A0ABS1JQ91_9BURK|nr:cytochrome b/b6 domain-containing protein [Ramlibacter alkalitolerans]MBL0426403.1 cytochrome b/b6 domain-containing protein [Ramlibacter alkalitolerans]